MRGILGDKLANAERRDGAAVAIERALAFGWRTCARTLGDVSAERDHPIQLRSHRSAEDIWTSGLRALTRAWKAPGCVISSPMVSAGAARGC